MDSGSHCSDNGPRRNSNVRNADFELRRTWRRQYSMLTRSPLPKAAVRRPPVQTGPAVPFRRRRQRLEGRRREGLRTVWELDDKD
jgi:hypothetical protein